MTVTAISNIGMATAFAAGVVSFLSPSVLSLVPGYVSYVSGAALGRAGSSPMARLSIVLLSASFVLCFSTVFIAFGATATAISQSLLHYRYEANIVAGAVVALFGVFMTGLVPMPGLQRDLRFHGGVGSGRPLSAYVLGFAFGLGWTPCIGPVLGAILAVSAVSSTVSAGTTLLIAYSLGLGLPFLGAAMFTDALMRRRTGLGEAGRLLRVGTGTVMIAMGAAMVTGTMTTASFWLLNTFPWLSRIG
jgi:cytochrome c-type biogenesis protein